MIVTASPRAVEAWPDVYVAVTGRLVASLGEQVAAEHPRTSVSPVSKQAATA